MISDSKLLYHAERIAGDYKPITADVFLTNYCNNKCGFCCYGRWESGPKQYMSADVFEMALDRLVDIGVKAVILTGGGEPCINPDFEKIVRALEDRGVEYGVNTNFMAYRDCDPVFLKVSLDAWDVDSYKRIRGVDGYDDVRANILRFRGRHKKTSLGIQQIGLSVDDVERFYKGNCDLPVDYIVIRPMESTGGKYYADGQKMAAAVVDCVKELQNKDSRVKLNFKFQYLRQRFDYCIAHWAQIALDQNANVIYCCHKPYEVIGSVFDRDIMEKHRKAVTDMAKCDIPCRMTGPNLACAVPKDVNFI